MSWFRGNDWRPYNQSNIEIAFFCLCNKEYHILHELDEMPLVPPNTGMFLEGIPMMPDLLWPRCWYILQFDGPMHQHQKIWRRDRFVDEIQRRHHYYVRREPYESFSDKFVREVYKEVSSEINLRTQMRKKCWK